MRHLIARLIQASVLIGLLAMFSYAGYFGVSLH